MPSSISRAYMLPVGLQGRIKDDGLRLFGDGGFLRQKDQWQNSVILMLAKRQGVASDNEDLFRIGDPVRCWNDDLISSFKECQGQIEKRMFGTTGNNNL